jgi:anti-sigma-K factor RskA
MKHRTEEELIGYRDGEQKNREEIAMHLKECGECQSEMERIEAVFTALDAMPVPDPGEDYEQRVWSQIADRLPEKRASFWQGWFSWKPLAVAGAMAALIVLAFVIGVRKGRHEGGGDIADSGKVRERVLVVAVGDHLGRSEMMLMELENAQPAESGQKVINISTTQRRAEDLVEENRLYRQTALKEGDQAMASTLDELERVLLDIANSPDEVTPVQFEALRKRIETRGILFKVRVVNQDLRERGKAAQPSPTQEKSGAKERNKV